MKNKVCPPDARTPSRLTPARPPSGTSDRTWMKAYPSAAPAHSRALSPPISHIRYPAFSPDAHPLTARLSLTKATPPCSSPSSPSIRLFVRRSVRSTAVDFAHQLAIRLFVNPSTRPPASLYIRPPVHPPIRPPTRASVNASTRLSIRSCVYFARRFPPRQLPPQPIVRQLLFDALFANLSPYCYRMVTSVLKLLSLAV